MSRIPLFLALLLAASTRVRAQQSVTGAAPASGSRVTPVAASQPAAKGAFDFTIDNMMRGPEVYGRAPEDVRWSADGRWIYFEWDTAGTDWREPLHHFRVRAEPGAAPERITDVQMDSAGPVIAEGDLSPDRRQRAVSYGGDLWVVDVHRASARRLTQTVAKETSPRFDATGARVFFVRDDNVFSIDLANGFEKQLTDIRAGPAPKDSTPATGQRGALERDQRALFGVVRDRLRKDSIEKAEQRARDSLHAKPLWLEKDEKVASIAVSPSGTALLVVTRTPAGDRARATEIPEYVTASGYTEEIKERTKVGDAQDAGRVAFVQLPSGASRWLTLVPEDSAHSPAFVGVLGWNDAGTKALLFTVRNDWKARFIQTVDADSGRVSDVDVLRDSAWVDGPAFGEGGWYDGGRRIWFTSEADGFDHLYTVAADGSDRVQLTRGNWEVLDVSLSNDGKWFWLHTSEGSPFERQFYRMSVRGGARERITTKPGGHTVTPSPDETMLADIYSYANRPPELFVLRNRAGSRMAQLTTSATKEWLSFPWIVPEIVWITASDGVKVPARIYRPKDMHADANGSAVIFVHGAGYLHNVVDYWSDYPREYMFNQYLASHGYVVLDVDYRGSAGYGRDWRTAIYRHMGGRDLQDEVDASKWLTSELSIPPERVGIYGGSYGGFMTLMALFTQGKYFGAGAALRSVTDWAHYNHWYTSRILNLPQTDSVAYRQSSPIYFASGLNRPLLMCHGMEDRNVHFQDIVRLSQRLIELGKTNWTLAVYPVENHSFVRPDSWSDEYRRIFDLFERTLQPATVARSAGQ